MVTRRPGGPPRIALLGPHGSGKTTVAHALRRLYPGVDHFAIRTFFDDQKRQRTPLGRRAMAEPAGWLSDDLVCDALLELFSVGRFLEGYVFDGFPGTIAQARFLTDLHARRSESQPLILFLDAPEDVTLRRALGRWTCGTCDATVTAEQQRRSSRCEHCDGNLSKRPEDETALFTERQRLYGKRTVPVLEYFAARGALNRIDARQPLDEVVRRSASVCVWSFESSQKC